MENIYIESPLFKLLSKRKFLEKYLQFIFHKKFQIIPIIDEYKKAFDELNNMDTSIYYDLRDINKINLKEININFNKIKALTICNFDYELLLSKKENKNVMQNDFNNFFDILFSFNIESNLIYLNLELNYCKINPILFEKINNFKSLRYLKIKGINFDKDFIIKLKLLI